jgi:hypothetical protein
MILEKWAASSSDQQIRSAVQRSHSPHSKPGGESLMLVPTVLLGVARA